MLEVLWATWRRICTEGAVQGPSSKPETHTCLYIEECKPSCMHTLRRACLVENVSNIPCRWWWSEHSCSCSLSQKISDVLAVTLAVSPLRLVYGNVTVPFNAVGWKIHPELSTTLRDQACCGTGTAWPWGGHGCLAAWTTDSLCVYIFSAIAPGEISCSSDFSFSGATFHICLGLNCLSVVLQFPWEDVLKHGTRKNLFWLLIFIHKIAKKKYYLLRRCYYCFFLSISA